LHRIYPNEREVKDTTDTQMFTSYIDLHLEVDNGERLKTNLYDESDDFTFQLVNFLSSVAIFQHRQCILELVSSTVIFLTDLSCCRKIYSSKATLLLCWSYRRKNSTVVITIWLTATKYPYLKWQWIFSILRKCFLSSVTDKTFTGLDYIYMSITIL
jgi:hypothetical protein